MSSRKRSIKAISNDKKDSDAPSVPIKDLVSKSAICFFPYNRESTEFVTELTELVNKYQLGHRPILKLKCDERKIEIALWARFPIKEDAPAQPFLSGIIEEKV